MKLEELKPFISGGINTRVFLSGDLKVAFSKHPFPNNHGISIHLSIWCDYRNPTEEEISELSQIFLSKKAYPAGTTAILCAMGE